MLWILKYVLSCTFLLGELLERADILADGLSLKGTRAQPVNTIVDKRNIPALVFIPIRFDPIFSLFIIEEILLKKSLKYFTIFSKNILGKQAFFE